MDEYDDGTYFLLTFAWVATLALVLLKLFKKIDLEWFIVVSPFIVSIIALLVMKLMSSLLKVLLKIKHKNKGV